MEEIKLPLLSWFVGDVYAKFGNRYVGSVGAVNIAANAFCYVAWLDRSGDVPLLKCESYDVLNRNNTDAHEAAEFPATEDGLREANEWVNTRYSEYLAAGKNKLTVKL